MVDRLWEQMDESFDKSDCVQTISSGWDERSMGKVTGGCHDVGGIDDGIGLKVNTLK
jgi:hypothetical protein